MAGLRIYKGAQRTIFTFYTKRSLRQAVIIAWLAAISSATSLIGFINAYPTEQSRKFLEASFGSNIGLKILLGNPSSIDTVGGFVVWRTSGILVIIGSIWALMLATKLLGARSNLAERN